MDIVRTVHGALGESLAVIYLLIALGSYLRRRQGGLPMWVVGLAHLLIAAQVVLGTVLYSPGAAGHQHLAPDHRLSGARRARAYGRLA